VAIIGREMCERVVVYTFSNKVVLVPARRGFGLRDAINRSQPHGGTELGKAVAYVAANEKADRLIVITDEQSHDRVHYPTGIEKSYMVNVASARNGVGYGQWIHIDGFSESIFTYILESEGIGANLSDADEVFED
jgi:60 kDa SS-A/Ro ribonucleoprotein